MKPAPWSGRYQPTAWPMNGDEGAGDAERDRQQEAGRLVGCRRQQAGQDARDEADDDNPKHVDPFS